jgi:xylulokinase
LAGGLNQLTSYTNNNMLTGFTAGKILWMKENEPENYAKTVKIINPKD